MERFTRDKKTAQGQLTVDTSTSAREAHYKNLKACSYFKQKIKNKPSNFREVLALILGRLLLLKTKRENDTSYVRQYNMCYIHKPLKRIQSRIGQFSAKLSEARPMLQTPNKSTIHSWFTKCLTRSHRSSVTKIRVDSTSKPLQVSRQSLWTIQCGPICNEIKHTHTNIQHWDSNTSEIDCFSQTNWRQEINCCNPPVQMGQKALDVIIASW